MGTHSGSRPYARWKAGFEAANEADTVAARRRTADQDFATLAALMHAARVLGWVDQLRAGDDEVRERWLRLHHRDA